MFHDGNAALALILPFIFSDGLSLEAEEIAAEAESATGNAGLQVGSRDAAEQAAKEWVGKNPEPITDRSTGKQVGWKSADGTKVARFTSTDKSGYINLENKATGSNLHVKW